MSHPPSQLILLPGQAVRLHPLPTTTLKVVSGRVWVTQSGDPQDHFLGPGTSLMLDQGRLVLEAQGGRPASCKLLPPPGLHRPQRAPAPSKVATPSTANTAAAIECTSFIGILLASLSPTKTAGTSAISIPRVVPTTTSSGVA
jgi:Protein of unknown function (DUF2917)